jgi:Predicted periplasmic lipoprotein (DUF2279)
MYALIMVALGYAWYSPQWISSFHFFDDLPEWQQMDKVAHAFWTFQVSAVASRLLRWATIENSGAVKAGAVMGFLFVSGIEIFDGFSVAYGASVYDVAANAVGATAFFLQGHFWKRILVWPKFSFHPTNFAPLRQEVLGNGLLEEILKDYNGQTFWYSVKLPWLPLPRWLTLAAGVGAEGMIFGRVAENEAVGLHPERRYLLSLDIDLSHIKTESRWLRVLLYIPNIIKVPAPAIEISTQGIRFHAIYF